MEFKVDPGLSKSQVMSMMGSQVQKKPQMEDRLDLEEQMEQTPFMKRVVETCQYQMNSNGYMVVELGYMRSRAKPYRDDEDLSTVCPRCLSSNSIINASGNICAACN